MPARLFLPYPNGQGGGKEKNLHPHLYPLPQGRGDTGVSLGQKIAFTLYNPQFSLSRKQFRYFMARFWGNSSYITVDHRIVLDGEFFPLSLFFKKPLLLELIYLNLFFVRVKG